MATPETQADKDKNEPFIPEFKIVVGLAATKYGSAHKRVKRKKGDDPRVVKVE